MENKAIIIEKIKKELENQNLKEDWCQELKNRVEPLVNEVIKTKNTKVICFRHMSLIEVKIYEDKLIVILWEAGRFRFI